MKEEIYKIKTFLKQRDITAEVSTINGNTIIIKGLSSMTTTNAKAIASAACKGKWIYLSPSTTKRKDN